MSVVAIAEVLALNLSETPARDFRTLLAMTAKQHEPFRISRRASTQSRGAKEGRSVRSDTNLLT